MKNKRTTIVAGGLICICLLSGCTSTALKVTPTALPTVTPIVAVSPTATKSPTNLPQKQTEEVIYIGNKSSKKFHLSDCNTLPSAKNRVKFKSRDEAVKWGYSPCYNCQP